MGQKKMEGLKPGWQTFDHVADIGIRGIGRSLEEAFENGAKALFSIMIEDLDSVSCKQKQYLECSSYDLTGLFVAWINTLIGLADLKGMVFACFNVEIKDTHLKATVQGEKWSEKRHGRGIEVKGATFTEALVEKRQGLWIAQCVVDV